MKPIILLPLAVLAWFGVQILFGWDMIDVRAQEAYVWRDR